MGRQIGWRVSASVLAAMMFLGWGGSAGANDQGPQQAGTTASPMAAKDSDIVPIGDSPARGAKNAPVTIVMFGEYQCPFCAKVEGTLAQILKDYPKEVRVVFKHHPLDHHVSAAPAAEAAVAAHQQGKFWAMHDLLFQNQRALSAPELEQYARQAGLDMKRYAKSLQDGSAKKIVERDKALAQKLGATGTPDFFINGINLKGAQPYEKFKAIIDAELPQTKGQSYAARVKANYTTAPTKAKNGPDTGIYKVPVDGSPILGDPNAVVTIVAFTDYQCPFSSRVQTALAQVMGDYKGQVRLVQKHNPLPFHKDAMPAALAALAVHQQGKFWPLHDLLFQNQKALTPQDIEKYAKNVGVDVDLMIKTVNTGDPAKQIAADQALAQKLGAGGTPTFFINGVKLVGAQPYDAFKTAIDDAIKRAQPLIAQGLSGQSLYDAINKDAIEVFVAEPSPIEVNTNPTDPQPPKIFKVSVGKAPVRGPAKAPITIIMFGDFQCPFCARSIDTIRQVEAAYPGQVRFAFKQMPLPFHKDARPAALAALAAHQQNKFWPFFDLLFQNQKDLTREALIEYARQAGLDIKKFTKALDDPKLEALIASDEAEAKGFGASGTPTFYINGTQLVGAQPLDAFKKIIDAQLQ